MRGRAALHKVRGLVTTRRRSTTCANSASSARLARLTNRENMCRRFQKSEEDAGGDALWPAARKHTPQARRTRPARRGSEDFSAARQPDHRAVGRFGSSTVQPSFGLARNSVSITHLCDVSVSEATMDSHLIAQHAGYSRVRPSEPHAPCQELGKTS